MRAPLVAIAVAGVFCYACNEPSRALVFSPSSPSTPAAPSPDPGRPVAGPVEAIAVGQRFVGVVTPALDPACYPNWDARGHCRTLSVVAPRDGRLTIRLEWPRRSADLDLMDLFVVREDGSWEVAFDGTEYEELQLAVGGGQRYLVIAMSVDPLPLEFILIGDM